MKGEDDMPKVSVVVPVYNCEKAVERCIRSILNQEFKDLEVIAVDDGSKDSSGEILDHIAEEDSRLIVVHKENGGVSRARNTALELIQGEYVQFLDSDDWIPTDSTKMLVKCAEETDADLVVGYFYRVVGENVAMQGSIETTNVLTLQEYAQLMMTTPADYYYGVLWNKLYKASIFKEFDLKMDEDVKFAEDFIFNLEYLIHTRTIAPLKVPVYYYVKTEGSLVSQGMSLTKLYQMKTNVFSYYNNFYKNVLDEKDYRKDRLQIASFLIDGARDEFAIGVLPSVKKLGEERIQAKYSTKKDTLIAYAYYLNKAFDQKLNTIANQFELNLNDVKVIAALMDTDSENTLEAISDFTNISSVTVSAIITKLDLKRYVKMEISEGKADIFLTEKAAPIQKAIEDMVEDLESIIFNDVDEDEQETFTKLISKMIMNIRTIV